jgi:hypothetical protein
LGRDFPKTVALNLRVLEALLAEGYFDPKDIPDPDTSSVQIYLACTFTKDFLDRQESESKKNSTTDSISSTSTDKSD